MRLIDADSFKDAVTTDFWEHFTKYHDTDQTALMDMVIESLDEQPTVEVESAKSGEWAHLGGDEWCCTNCGNVIFTEGSWEKPTQKFCDECGAKMKIEVVEEW